MTEIINDSRAKLKADIRLIVAYATGGNGFFRLLSHNGSFSVLCIMTAASKQHKRGHKRQFRNIVHLLSRNASVSSCSGSDGGGGGGIEITQSNRISSLARAAAAAASTTIRKFGGRRRRRWTRGIRCNELEGLNVCDNGCRCCGCCS